MSPSISAPASHVNRTAVPVRTVPLVKADLPTAEFLEGALREMLASGRMTNFGKHVTEFERRAATYLGAEVVTTSSGTLGLILTLQALGLEPGQKVILPSFTFVATAQAARPSDLFG